MVKVADIITEYGSYYINSGQNMSRLVRQLRHPSTTEEAFRTIVTDDTERRLSQTKLGRILQPFQKKWTPISEVEFVPEPIKQYPVKIDYEDYPDDLEESWLGFLADNNLDRTQWPFVSWLVEQELLPQGMEDLEMNEIYSGVYSAPSQGSAGPAGTAMNGIKKIINDHIANGRITPITTGAPETDPVKFVEQIEDFADQISERYWMTRMVINMSPQLARRYRRGYKSKYGTVNDFSSSDRNEVDDTMLTVRGLQSHIGSNKWWVTPRENAVRMVKKSSNQDRVEIEGEDRKVKIWTDFYRGVGFPVPEAVFTNDQDLGAAGSGSGSA